MEACRQVVADAGQTQEPDIHPYWRGLLLGMASDILQDGPEGFRHIPSVRQGLLTGDYDDTLRQLSLLQALPDWESRWRPALVASEAGGVEPSYWCPESSGNQIRQAYLLARFEAEMATPITDFDQIIEFGGGFGELCRLAYRLGFRGRYVLLDPQPVRALQRWYLQAQDGAPELANDGVLAQSGICTLAHDALAEVLDQGEPKRTAFLAHWSLSQTATVVRDKVLHALRDGAVDAIWIVYQERFGISNSAYFASCLTNFMNVYDVTLKPLQPVADREDYFYGHACLGLRKIPGRSFLPTISETQPGFDAQDARYVPIDELFHRLRRAMQQQFPYSALRLGDGEGRIMGYPDYVPRYQVIESWETWFGHRQFTDDDVSTLRELLRGACQTADVIGVPQTMPYTGCEFGRVRALLAQGGYCDPQVGFTHAGFHARLAHYGYYEALLSGVPRIGVIGPRDLRDILPERLGVGAVEWLPVPPEMKYSDLPETEKEKLVQADAHWKTRFPELMERDIPDLLARHPGMVVLVGAGVLGKVYCGRVKALGGIAIDVGSMMDMWAGLNTRGNKLFDGLRLVAH